jgi:hypothetical protein
MVYPFDQHPMTVDMWTFILVIVRLVHSNMEQHLEAQDVGRFPPLAPSCEFLGISPKLFIVLSQVCEEGDTSEIDIASINLLAYLVHILREHDRFLGLLPSKAWCTSEL